MNIFNLPDLGEGLPDAEIHEWFVKEGDTVVVDQPLVSMETAKAVVDVPCPQTGVISKLYGKPGDIIKTGEPLVAFVSTASKAADKGTVVGNLEESSEVFEDNFTIGVQHATQGRIKTTPAVKMLAKKLGVDLSTIKGTGEFGVITRDDVQTQADKNAQIPVGFEPLRGVRRAMLNSMVQSHAEVVPVSIFDEADISAWKSGTDITVRLIRAIIEATKSEPALNAWFDTKHGARQCFNEVHLGLAMDNEEGLFVPVIHDAGTRSDTELRSMINEFKQSVGNREITADKLKGATITLSNFGKFAGRFASPIIVPPMVAILAVGRLYQGVVAVEGKVEIHNILPLSLSFDHRAVTGGEATRFLGSIIQSLQMD
ncbi:dihydrolipoamide acetyltransferase family protein [Legionella longbeachae]|uniref:Dihydrolipoamide acetyltransferase component of pyruvate dehydrogenase complex n=1 Tax=Legionella longbeachae serogroup 1 (strain NSW150) TaxID=661367 RepID=D3HSJ6_LEGLN|nr:dihydrolipoamide acetyltransferase family protein [Legionella longbeachae]VEE02379.1 branched-chain alpha-keto acid dehydrogenase subunit E2 [Legionella oakridgensis]HBD7398130.1 2-oxo acid dehydrogenase subunit E2 [Legionella pneumophila]ARB91339.1 2-oxo acid dehydrogenase subunit E2 [Legionella longbeachae]ARM32237.1 2-oxo acid dehydrogenase subunit E2 [Legionella longbeachae]EEZ94981.1 dihydrolipoamide acetyltransferase [Legionella longbeachae D-4968]